MINTSHWYIICDVQINITLYLQHVGSNGSAFSCPDPFFILLQNELLDPDLRKKYLWIRIWKNWDPDPKALDKGMIIILKLLFSSANMHTEKLTIYLYIITGIFWFKSSKTDPEIRYFSKVVSGFSKCRSVTLEDRKLYCLQFFQDCRKLGYAKTLSINICFYCPKCNIIKLMLLSRHVLSWLRLLFIDISWSRLWGEKGLVPKLQKKTYGYGSTILL